MGFIVSYDDTFGMPSSEIKLDSGEHVSLTLDKTGLVIKALRGPGTTERVLFKGSPKVVANICAGLIDDETLSKVSPLRVLASTVVLLPNAAAVQGAFTAAADV